MTNMMHCHRRGDHSGYDYRIAALQQDVLLQVALAATNQITTTGDLSRSARGKGPESAKKN
jgi:hypothetical protein